MASILLPVLFHPVCGDGSRLFSEACDDGNDSNGDGCSAQCSVECGFVCGMLVENRDECASVCGDGVLALSESCDDGNRVSKDGCSQNCQIEAAFTCTVKPSLVRNCQSQSRSICRYAPFKTIVLEFASWLWRRFRRV